MSNALLRQLPEQGDQSTSTGARNQLSEKTRALEWSRNCVTTHRFYGIRVSLITRGAIEI